MSTPATRRRVAGEIQAEFECSQRRCCRALGFARSSVLYRSRRQEQPGLVERLKALAAERPRFGYRRLHRMLGREGFAVNHKRVHRLYRAEGLALRRKQRKRIASVPRLVRVAPTRPNERWSMDFVSDATVNGRRFRVFNVVDEFTREALATVVATSISGARVARELDLLATHRGKPATIVSDNGPEFISKAMDAWAYAAGVKLHFIRPGKPVENAYVESCNGRFRDECLNMHWFTSVHDAARIIEAWKDDYNHQRPHSSLDGLTPAEFADKVKAGLTLSAA